MIDAWSGPTPLSNQFPANEPDGIRKLLDKIKAIETELRDVRSHLPGAGGISNDALSSPVVPDVVNLFAFNFAVPTTFTEILGVDLVVPANCTRLQVNATTWVYATNNSASQGTLGVNTNLYGGVGLGANGHTYTATVAVGASGTVSAPVAAMIVGLTPGATIRLYANYEVPVAPAWTADAFNAATLTATLLWLR